MRDSAWFMSSRTRATRETENLGSTSILLVPTGEHGRPAALCGSLEHGPAACAPSGFLTRCLGNASGIVSGVKLRWAQDWKVCVPCSRERRLPAIGARQSALRSALRLSTTDRPKPRKRVHFQTRNRAAPDRPDNRLSRQPAAASDTDYAPVHQPAPNRVLSPKSPAPVPPKSARKIPR